MTDPAAPQVDRSPLIAVCIIVMTAIVVAKVFWLAMGIISVGFTTPLLRFAAAVLSCIAAIWLLTTGNRNLGIGLAWLGVILAIIAGQLGGVTPGPGHSRFEEQYRNHILDYLFIVAATLQFWLLLKRDRAALPTTNA
jgi:hypothetical protein